jgi:hypothetical protein
LVVARVSGVDGELLDLGARGVVVFPGSVPGAIDNELDVVCGVECLRLDLAAIAEDDPSAHAVGSTKLVDLHWRGWLVAWRIPHLFAGADGVIPRGWCWCLWNGVALCWGRWRLVMCGCWRSREW